MLSLGYINSGDSGQPGVTDFTIRTWEICYIKLHFLLQKSAFLDCRASYTLKILYAQSITLNRQTWRLELSFGSQWRAHVLCF